MAIPFVSSRVSAARRTSLSFTLCCLLFLLLAMAASAQAPAQPPLLWTQTGFTGFIAYSPTQSLIAAGEGFGQIFVFQADGTLVQTIYTGQGDVAVIAFSPDGQTLASSGLDGTIKLWRVRDGACLATLTGHTSCVYSVAFSPDGQTLASGSADCTVKLWDVNPGDGSYGACLKTLTGTPYAVASVAFAPNGQVLASGSGGGYAGIVTLWDVNPGDANYGACLKTITATYQALFYSVYSMAFSPDSQTLAVGGCQGDSTLWDVNPGDANFGACLQTLSDGGYSNSCVVFSPDGQTLAADDFRGYIGLWQMSDGAWQETGEILDASVISLAFMANGQTLIAGCDSGSDWW